MVDGRLRKGEVWIGRAPARNDGLESGKGRRCSIQADRGTVVARRELGFPLPCTRGAPFRSAQGRYASVDRRVPCIQAGMWGSLSPLAIHWRRRPINPDPNPSAIV